MRILILGAGEAGQQLAEKLSEEKHEIIIVDREEYALEQGEAQFDVMTVRGSASSPRVLEEAQISATDILVAVTGCDEANLLACLYAHAAGVPHKLARVADRDYLPNGARLDLHRAGVDCLVCPQEENAREMLNMLLAPGLEQIVDILDSQLFAISLRIPADSHLAGHALKEYADHELIGFMRVFAYTRDEQTRVPSGETIFQEGDLLYMVVDGRYLDDIQDWLMPTRQRLGKVIVAGGGSLGLHLTRLIEERMKTVLVERCGERAEHCSAVLDKTLVLHGDVLDMETIQSADVARGTAFVAVTDDDEDNIIACLLARKLGCSFTMTQLRKIEYVPVIDQLDLIDRVISPHVSLIAAVLGFVRGEQVRAARILRDLPGELLDIVVSSQSPWVGPAIRQLELPRGAVMIAVVRESEVLVPTGDLALLPDDRVLFFALDQATKKLLACCKT